MLKIDKTEIHISGGDGTMLSELASLANTVVRRIEEMTGMPRDEAFDNFHKIYQLMHLVDSGMNIVEGAKLLGIEKIVGGVTDHGPEGQKCDRPINPNQLDGLEELVANNIKNDG